MRKIICVMLCALLLLPTAVYAGAAETETGTFRMIAYNVSGIPLVGGFQGSTFTTTRERARLIGQLLNGTGADFIGTEEDFNGADALAAEMTDYLYRSYTSGGLAQGQGLNVYSKHPVYNVKRVKWNEEYGVLSGSMDALSNKGFLYCLAELVPGVYIHIIQVHMDAGYEILSQLARANNFKQLASFINKNLNDGRALIVQGDFNFKFKRQLKDDLVGNLLEPTGLKDVWAELENNGIYDTTDPGHDWEGAGDDLDRIRYRSGDDLALTPVSKSVPDLRGENGERYTDHDPMMTEFAYTVTGSLPAPEKLTEPHPESSLYLTLNGILWTFVRLFQAFAGLTELPYLIGQGVDILVNGNMP